MHYALYRKYRPNTFDEIVGQDFITVTLRRQVSEGTFAHAYLFTGTRGTGKTSCARILARAVNCLDPRDGNPCNECEICRGLISGGITDIVEIDAASNNSVDDIRRMREEIMYLPAAAKYKVYIIDEVHMLTGAAFNALLKTLEEPPAHALFILATTEAHKVPATILSRCQRFDFRRIPVSVISARISDILAQEGRTADERSIRLVAELGDGSMRDSLSILEKVMDLQTYEQAEEVLGVIGRRTLHALMQAAATGDTEVIFSSVDALYDSSKDMSLLCTELMREYRSMLLLYGGDGCERLIDCSAEDLDRLKSVSARYTAASAMYAMQVLQGAFASMARSSDKRADMEMALLRISMPDTDSSFMSVLARLDKLESDISELRASASRAAAPDVSNFSGSVRASAKSLFSGPDTLPDASKTASAGAAAAPDVSDSRAVSPDVPSSRAAAPDVSVSRGSASSSPIPSEPDSAAADSSFDESVVAPGTKDADIPEPAPSSDADPTADGVYRELASWAEICDYIKEKNMLLSLTLRNECCAVYRGSDMVILCGEERDRKDLNDPRALALIREAFEALRKTGYNIRVELGRKSDYLSNGELYEHAEESGLFEFRDDL